MKDLMDETIADTPTVAFGLGVAATLLISGIVLRSAHGTLATFALSAAIVWLAAALDHGGTRLEVFAFGLAVGIGGWQSLPTLFCSTLACAWLLLRWPAVERRRSFAVLAAVGFLLGALPRTVPSLSSRMTPRKSVGLSGDHGAADEDSFWAWDDGEDDFGVR
jgi:hypothetical protein